MKDTKSIQLLTLLKELLGGKQICLKNYALRQDISLRTAQRHMKELLEAFEENIIKDGDCYTFVSSNTIEKNILSYDKEDLSRVVDLFSLVDFDFTKSFDADTSKILAKLQKNYAVCYSIKQHPFEYFFNHKYLKEIKRAIKNHQYADIVYNNGEKFLFKECKLLKIIFSEGNFYVATLSDDESINNGFKFLRLSFIESISLQSKTFHKDIKAEFFLKDFQTIFSNYDVKSYEVIVEVDECVERFFRQKKFLSSQKIIKNDDKLLLSFQVTNDMEVLPLVKKWLPHLKIISPLTTKTNLQNQLKTYLNDNI